MNTRTQTQLQPLERPFDAPKPSVLASMRAVMAVLPEALIERPDEPVFRAVRRAQEMIERAREHNQCFEETFCCFDHNEFDQFERRIEALLEAEHAFIDEIGVGRAAALDEALILAQGQKNDLILATRYGFRHVPALRDRVLAHRGSSSVETTARQVRELLQLIDEHRQFLETSLVVEDANLERAAALAGALESENTKVTERASGAVLDERNRAWTLFVWAREQFNSMWRCVGELHPDAAG